MRMKMILVTTFLLACKKEEAAPPAKKDPPPAPAPSPPTSTKPMEDPIKQPGPAEDKPIHVDGFQTPESVLYDDQADIYLVSNINGKPTDKDDNGFIAQVSPDGKITNAAWIDGKHEKVTLNAPKGMAFLGDVLYVADIDAVRMFDRKTGEPKGEIAIKGATFMNDLVAGPDSIYATDSGLTPDFKPSGSAAVYQIKDGKATQLIKGDELAAPNGLALAGDVLWVAPFGSNELYSVKDGKRADITKLPNGGMDGLAVLDDGTVLVSSWEAKAIFAGKLGADAKFEVKFKDLTSPADFGWDSKRRRVVVPIFEGNALEIIPYK